MTTQNNANLGTFVEVALSHYKRDTSIPDAELHLSVSELFKLNGLVENRKQSWRDIVKHLLP